MMPAGVGHCNEVHYARLVFYQQIPLSSAAPGFVTWQTHHEDCCHLSAGRDAVDNTCGCTVCFVGSYTGTTESSLRHMPAHAWHQWLLLLSSAAQQALSTGAWGTASWVWLTL
jgi:hypothetical protein